jgi:uncharacterized protein
MATVDAAPLPLPLRNALAALTLAAAGADDALAAVRWLAGADPVPDAAAARRLAEAHLVDDAGVLLDVHRPYADVVRERAARALRASAAYRAAPPAPDAPVVERALVQAAALWDERLFFEVHEVLEPVWMRSAGATRQALQGLIQVAVAFHHHAHGNARGARSLMRDGRARLAASGDVLAPLDAAALLEATARWEAALAARAAVPGADLPRLPLRPGTRPGAGA